MNHAQDRASAQDNNYVMWAMADIWRDEGHHVDIVFGPEPVQADVVIVHVDRTIVGREYFRAAARSTVVLNAAARDISKRRTSTQLVGRKDPYTGPVIVKTSRNAGGVPEIRHRPRLRSYQRWRAGRGGLGSTSWMYASNYTVYDNPHQVPAGVHRNRKLIVERFLPERDGDLYCVRYFKFFGDRFVSAILRGVTPVVKRTDVVSFEDVIPHPEVVAMKNELGFDYGKLDYVIHEGKPIVFDVNKTPGMSADAEEERQRQATRLAPALVQVVARRLALL